MAIISHELVGSNPNGTRQDVTYKFTDGDTSATFRYEKLVPVGFDTEADMLSMYDNIDELNVESERGYIKGKVDNGEDVLDDILNPDYATTKDLAKAAMRYIMREKDPYIVLTLESFIDYARSNFTAAQLAALLDMTLAQVAKLNTRINSILDNKADFAVYDATQEEID